MTAARRPRVTSSTLPAKTAHKPATKPPLGDASNREAGAPLSAPAQPRKWQHRAVGCPAAALPRRPTAEATITGHLPGLEEDGVPRRAASGELPLAANADSQSFFGNVFAQGGEQGGSLRVTSITRSVSARRMSAVRLVAQPDVAEGRRLSRLPLGERPVVRAHTVAIPRDDAQRSAAPDSSRSSSSSSSSPSSLGALSISEEVHRAGEAHSSSTSATPQQSLSSSSSVPAGKISLGSCRAVPPPLPLYPGAAAPPGSSCQLKGEHATASLDHMAGERVCQGATTAVYISGSSSSSRNTAAEAASALQKQQRQQANCIEAGPCQEPLPAPFLSLRRSSAAALWRSMWLQGLQFHNAARSGQPIRAGSKWQFIPLDPNDALLSVLMFKTAVLPEQVIAGVARFQDIVLGSQGLYRQAVAAGVLSFGVWGMAAPDGSYQLLAEGKQIALPISFCRAPPHTVALFLACVWHEANRAEAAEHMSYTFTATGQRLAGEWLPQCMHTDSRLAIGDEVCLKYSPEELMEWVRLALGCEQAAHESVAALAHIAEFGAE